MLSIKAIGKVLKKIDLEHVALLRTETRLSEMGLHSKEGHNALFRRRVSRSKRRQPSNTTLPSL